MPNKPNPNSQKVVVKEMDLEKWDSTNAKTWLYTVLKDLALYGTEGSSSIRY